MLRVPEPICLVSCLLSDPGLANLEVSFQLFDVFEKNFVNNPMFIIDPWFICCIILLLFFFIFKLRIIYNFKIC